MSTPYESTIHSGLPGTALRRALWERYLALVAAGHPSDRVLVLLDGASREQWRGWLRGQTEAPPPPMGGQADFTPAGFIQAELGLWWACAREGLEALGIEVAGHHEPRFAAIDLAQYLLLAFTRHRRDGETGLFAEAYSAPHYQNVQLLDALARGIENGLGLQAPAEARAYVDHGGQPVSQAAVGLAGAIARKLVDAGHDPQLMAGVEEALALYVHGMLSASLLDHALQLEVYMTALWPHPAYREAFARRFDHVLVEHLDELPPRWHAMLEALLATGTRGCFTVQRDEAGGFAGGLREYLGADPAGGWALATRLGHITPLAQTPGLFAPLGRALLHELTRGTTGAIAGIELPADSVRLSLDAYSPAEMLGSACEQVARLLRRGEAEARHLAFVSPTLSPLLIWSLRQQLAPVAPLYVFAGTNRLRDYRPVRVLLTLAKLAHPQWGVKASRYELLELLELATGLNPLKLGRLAPLLFPDHQLAEPAMLLAMVPELVGPALKRYAALAQWVARPGASDLPGFFRGAFARVYAGSRLALEGLQPHDEAFSREVSQIGQLIELAERFEAVDARLGLPTDSYALRFFAFLDDSPIAERPFFQREPHQQAVVLATPSQLAERGFMGVGDELRSLFLLDIGSAGWLKRDRRELSNGRALAKGYPGGPYDPEREERDMNEKLGRVLMGCCLKARERLYVYGCMTDEEGRENDGQLPYLLVNLLGREAAFGARVAAERQPAWLEGA